MALGYIVIMDLVLLALALVLQVFLYRGISKLQNDNLIVILNSLYGIFLAYLNYTSLPTNYHMHKSIAFGLGLIGLVGLFVKFNGKSSSLLSKLLLTMSVVGGLILIFF